MDRRVKKYDVGVKGLVNKRSEPVHILKIVELDDGCIMVLYKCWNRIANRWIYEGQKLTELLYWNYLLWGLTKKERDELFKVNGFNWEEIKGY